MRILKYGIWSLLQIWSHIVLDGLLKWETVVHCEHGCLLLMLTKGLSMRILWAENLSDHNWVLWAPAYYVAMVCSQPCQIPTLLQDVDCYSSKIILCESEHCNLSSWLHTVYDAVIMKCGGTDHHFRVCCRPRSWHSWANYNTRTTWPPRK